MRTILMGVVVAVLLFAAGRSEADPVRGASVIYRTNSTHSYPALVVGVIDSDEADLMVLADDTLWYLGGVTYTAEGTPVLYVHDAFRGSGDGQWLENAAVYSGSRVSGESTPTLALNGSAVLFDSSHDTIYTASVKITTTLSLSGGAAGHADLVCDVNTTPTTIVATVQSESTGTLTIGLNLQASNTLGVQWRVPAGQRCKLTTGNDVGTPTYSLVRQRLQTLD